MCVDDDPTTVALTKILLDDAKFCEEKVFCKNASEAIKILKKAINEGGTGDSLPELILLDLKMPQASGWDFLEEYAKLPDPGIPVFVVSSTQDPHEKAKAIENPYVSGFYKKPLSYQDLMKLKEEHFSEAF